MNNKIRLVNLACGVPAVFFGTAFGVAVVLFILKFFYFDDFSTLLGGAEGILVKSDRPLANADRDTLARLISAGAVVTPDMLLNTISSFYNALLAWFAGLLTVAGIASLLYIRGMSVQKAEQEIEQKFKALTRDTTFISKVVELVGKSEAMNTFTDELNERVGTSISDVEGLKTAVVNIVQTIASMQQPDRPNTSGEIPSDIIRPNAAPADTSGDP